ncbi:MAG: HAD-IA family hydrolase [Rhodospirillales bacterium]|nr:HAD-IA family hydrolase [Rhodospirillales bacterium]MDP6645213.1 HAD-IA family hydrolase [Rhodospirillales bacterium]MDP6840392.1 HAD-IA family hydrolase [Rhodospirillales bacterium]
MSAQDLKLLVLDCDGTLVDSQTAIVDTMHAAFGENGVARPDADAVRHVVGLELLEAIARLAPTLGPATHDKICTSYRNYAKAKRADNSWRDPLYPGAREAIDALNGDGWLIGVATGKSRAGLDQVLDEHGMQGHFATLQTSDRAAGKPNPEMLFRALEETGADAGRAVMVGDTSYDMEMAVNANIPAIGVSWGYHQSAALKSAGAVTVIDRFDQLPDAAAGLIAANIG